MQQWPSLFVVYANGGYIFPVPITAMEFEKQYCDREIRLSQGAAWSIGTSLESEEAVKERFFP